MDWWNGRSRSPLLFSLKMGKIHWREVEESSSQNVQQWRREIERAWQEKWGRSSFYRGHKNVAVGGKKCSPETPAWGRPTPRPGRPGIFPANEASKRTTKKYREPSLASSTASSEQVRRPGIPTWGRPARGKAGKPPEDPGLGLHLRASWAGWPPEGPGLIPAWGRPGRPINPFFSFLF